MAKICIPLCPGKDYSLQEWIPRVGDKEKSSLSEPERVRVVGHREEFFISPGGEMSLSKKPAILRTRYPLNGSFNEICRFDGSLRFENIPHEVRSGKKTRLLLIIRRAEFHGLASGHPLARTAFFRLFDVDHPAENLKAQREGAYKLQASFFPLRIAGWESPERFHNRSRPSRARRYGLGC